MYRRDRNKKKGREAEARKLSKKKRERRYPKEKARDKELEKTEDYVGKKKKIGKGR